MLREHPFTVCADSGVSNLENVGDHGFDYEVHTYITPDYKFRSELRVMPRWDDDVDVRTPVEVLSTVSADPRVAHERNIQRAHEHHANFIEAGGVS